MHANAMHASHISCNSGKQKGMYIHTPTSILQNATLCKPNRSRPPLQTAALSIILAQAIEARQITRTVKIPIPNLSRQNPIRHARLPIPLRRALRRPSPIKPPPSRLKRSHLRLGIRQEPFLVGVGIAAGVGVGVAARAGGGCGGAGGGEDGGRAVG